MNDRRAIREIKNMQKTVLKNIDTTAREICHKWETKMLPLTTLRVIIDKSKPTGDLEVSVQFRKTLDSLYNSCVSVAKSMGSKKIPLSELKKGTTIIYNEINKIVIPK